MTGEQGEMVAKTITLDGDWNGSRQGPRIPPCTASLPTYIEANGQKEYDPLLRFASESDWLLQVSMTTFLDHETSMTISYYGGWAECGYAQEWTWKQFDQAECDSR
jgi:hypothetical protein